MYTCRLTGVCRYFHMDGLSLLSCTRGRWLLLHNIVLIFPVNFRGEGEWLGVGCSATCITANWSVDHTRSPLRFTVIQVTKQWMQWILKQTLKQRCCHKRQEHYITSVLNFSIIGRRQALLPWYWM